MNVFIIQQYFLRVFRAGKMLRFLTLEVVFVRKLDRVVNLRDKKKNILNSLHNF